MTQCIIIAPKRSGHNFIKSMMLSWRPDLQIRDLENLQLNRFPLVSVDCPADTVYVLQTRDLLNYVASIIRQHNHNGRLTHSRVYASLKHWYRLTRELYNETTLTDERHPHSTMIRIVYDHFLVDRTYRQRICAAINGVYHERALRYIPGGGGGSSFDGFTYQGRAKSMAVLTRYLELDEHELQYMRSLWRVDGLVPFYRRIMRPSADRVAFLRQTHKIIT